MIIKQKRVGNIDRYTKMIKAGTVIRVGVSDADHFTSRLQQIGFSLARSAGEAILPAIIGPVSRFNAEGGEIVHKDQPKEQLSYQREWHWTEWHGPYERVHQSKIVDVPYERYPRTPLAPPSIELAILNTTAGEKIIVGPETQYSEANKELIKHTINLFLELFGECQFFTAELDQVVRVPIKRLNWQILPPGQRPWQQLKSDLQLVIDQAPESKRVVIEDRLGTINQFSPDFAAVGRGGFQGYVVLGFSDSQLYVLESLLYGNATYVLGQDWESISKLTKAEILQENLHNVRLIHREGWIDQVRSLLSVREKNAERVH